jgi:hypothetical protein
MAMAIFFFLVWTFLLLSQIHLKVLKSSLESFYEILVYPLKYFDLHNRFKSFEIVFIEKDNTKEMSLK